MKTKTKLAGIVIAFMLALSAMVVGIWAVSTATVNLGGNISFTADDIYAKITGSISGASAEDNTTLNTLNYSATTEAPSEADLNSWKGKSLNFADKTTDIVIAITIENLSSERSLDVIIKDTIGAQTNLNKSVSFNGSEESALGNKYTIEKGNSATYTIKLSIANKNNSVQAKYGYDLSLYDENFVAPEIKVISNDTNLGSASGGVSAVYEGDEITLTATAEEGKTFLGWAVDKSEIQATSNEGIISAQSTETLPNISNMQVVSTDTSYTFTYSADKPTTYYALFNETTEENLTIGDLKYTIYKEAKLACVKDGSSATGPITIPESISKNEINYLVYTIGDAAFSDSDITSIVIPNSVISIGNDAFDFCGSLTSATIGNSVEIIGSGAFNSCYNLTSIIIPDSVETIGDRAFRDCEMLNSATIGNSVTSIGNDAFKSCKKLTGDLVIPDSVKIIGDYAFAYCDESLNSVTIGNGITSIGDYAFEECFALKSLTIGNGLISIGYAAVRNCQELTSVVIPDSVETIGDEVFYNCNNLSYNKDDNGYYLGSTNNKYLLLVKAKDTLITSCEINSNTKFIHSSAFYNCTSLTSITIPDSVTSIATEAFYNCTSLTSITIPDSVASIDNSAFEGCSGLTSITIPNSVIRIGNSAFDGCGGLESIVVDNNNSVYDSRNDCNAIIETNSNKLITGCKNTVIPNDITSIGDSAFYACSGLKSITIPNRVISIDNRAFSSCSGLTSVTIGNSVTSIGYQAFYGCSSLTSITINAINPPDLTYTNAIPSNVTAIKVPSGSVNSYKAASGWSKYAAKIQAIV